MQFLQENQKETIMSRDAEGHLFFQFNVSRLLSGCLYITMYVPVLIFLQEEAVEFYQILSVRVSIGYTWVHS